MNIDKEFTKVLNILETDFGWVDTKNMEENNKEVLKEFMTVVKKLTIQDVSQQRELLKAFVEFTNRKDTTNHTYHHLINDFLDSL